MGKPPLANPEGSIAESIGDVKTTQGSEPSQYLQEEKTIVIPLVAASERGTAQTIVLARWAIDGDSPVDDRMLAPTGTLSIAGHVKSRENPRGPSRKAKYSLETDS